MLLPIVVFMIAGLLILGMVIAERYPVSTWKASLRALRAIAAQKAAPVRLVPQEAHLEELMTADDTDVYEGTTQIAGLVDVVEKAMVTAEAQATAFRQRAVRSR